jgi:hypothetical protein
VALKSRWLIRTPVIVRDSLKSRGISRAERASAAVRSLVLHISAASRLPDQPSPPLDRRVVCDEVAERVGAHLKAIRHRLRPQIIWSNNEGVGDTW